MANYQWNPLTDEKKFEDLVNDLCSAKYSLEFQIYGRKGQKQYGIDGSALSKDKKHILYQCKNKTISRNDSAIQKELLNDLETETNSMKAEFIDKKGYILDKFIFANAFKRDTKLQDKATELSLLYTITVVIWSWDEISDMLEEYIDIAKKYYPDYFHDIGRDDEFLIIKTNLKRKYKEVKEFRKTIFKYYSIYGTNFGSFTRATTFDELFNILEKEEVCLYCLLKELGEEYKILTQPINCDKLKVKIESINREEINGLILRINWNKIDKTCTIDGYLRFTSESFEPLNEIYEEVTFNYETIKNIVQENLENRSQDKTIELQLILPNELYGKYIDFQCDNRKVDIVKRLLMRIENYNQLKIDAIRYWQRNSMVYKNSQNNTLAKKLKKDSCIHIVNEETHIDEFQKYNEKHLCLLSNSRLDASIKDIYDYGVPIAFYSYSQKCDIIKNLKFKKKKVKDIKNTIFEFMNKNKLTHFIYDDYNDLDFLKHESKVEGTEDDYL